jgi:hypothetical protein
LGARSTKIGAIIVVLDGMAYPELRLFNNGQKERLFVR